MNFKPNHIWFVLVSIHHNSSFFLFHLNENGANIIVKKNVNEIRQSVLNLLNEIINRQED